MSTSGFLKLGDIKGAGEDPGHKDWIEIKSLTNAITNELDMNRGGGFDNGRMRFSQIELSRAMDKASVLLAGACAKGKAFDDAQIDFVKMINAKREVFLSIKLKTVRISHHSILCTDSDPTENLGLVFREIEWGYTAFPDGRAEGPFRDKASLMA